MYKNRVRYDVQSLIPQDARSILEIGAGDGLNYEIYPRDAYKVALEPEPRTDKKTIDKVPGGFNEYHHVFYEDYKDEKKFDLVVMCDVLEHVNDPRDFLEFAKNHLNPGGHILVSIPNFLGIENILQILITRDFRYINFDKGETGMGVLDINHKTFWTKKSFIRFAKESNLKVIKMVGIRKQLSFMPKLLSHSNFIPFQYGFLVQPL
ncbi:MAG: class I SAM-dependent methyltransferase [Fibrobacteraceae bacterium]|nr:class I SAM-dependent methyltransferase [Fibrobacteraceae bacterium]